MSLTFGTSGFPRIGPTFYGVLAGAISKCRRV